MVREVMPARPQFFGKGVHAAQAWHGGYRFRSVDFGVHHAPPAVELRGFAEQYVLGTRIERFAYCLDPVEPHDLDGACAVGKHCHKACLGSFALRGKRYEASAQLQCGHLAGQIAHAVYLRPVEVVCREMVQQVVVGVYPKLFGYQCGTGRAYAFDILYVERH